MQTGGLLAAIEEIAREFDGAVLPKNIALKRSQAFSDGKIEALRREAANAPEAMEGIHCIAVAGSLARRDACSESDLDLVVILDDEEKFDRAKFDAWLDATASALELTRSNPKGVFAGPIARSDLTAMAGRMDESYQNLSRRVLLLLESDYVYREKEYDSVIDDIIEKYSEDVKISPRKNFVFLLNDVIRYFRTICVNYQNTKAIVDDKKWPIRNVKLRHSRVTIYFSMIVCLGVLSKYEGKDKIDVLRCLVTMTPLERIFVAYEHTRDSGFFRFAEYYNVFLSLIGTAETRAELAGLDYEARYESNLFTQLKANSDALAAELLRFYRSRERDWDDRFFEYMLI